ncbi:MAG: DUF4282 domain-containing protein [Gaiellales bacterium]|nr:MAG: DUF4282 domain-containing protein [Gaiellales bacterium]
MESDSIPSTWTTNRRGSKMEESKGGSFGALFDFSFSSFVTLKLIKVIYFIVFILAVLAAIGVIIVGFQQSSTMGLAALLLSPVLFLVYILAARVWLELIVVLFRIEENTRKD